MSTNTEASGEHTTSPLSPGADVHLVKGNNVRATGVFRQKTPYQLESARMRQRNKQQAKRRSKTEGYQAKTVNEDRTKTARSDTNETKLSTYLILLWVLYDETGTQRIVIGQRLSSVLNDSDSFLENVPKYKDSDTFFQNVESYLSQRPLEALYPVDMTLYLKVRRAETFELQPVKDMIPIVEKHHEKILEYGVGKGGITRHQICCKRKRLRTIAKSNLSFT